MGAGSGADAALLTLFVKIINHFFQLRIPFVRVFLGKTFILKSSFRRGVPVRH